MFRKTNSAASANRPTDLMAGDRFKAETADHHISANADRDREHKRPPTSGNQAATDNKTAEQMDMHRAARSHCRAGLEQPPAMVIFDDGLVKRS
jgi:hypothetical protein